MARFLVVDDDESTVKGMTRLLTSDGHDVAAFTAGADAINALERQPFDAVVTDLDMPHIDGHEVVRAARQHQPDACVVVVTARADETQAALAEAGACIIANKPVDYDDLTKTIAECRTSGRPGAHDRCSMRSRTGGPKPLRLRRR
jgi:CheY-like chemotaxis protein